MRLDRLKIKIINNLNIFYSAVNNEIAIDKYLISKLNIHQISYVPVRAIKTLPVIQSLKIGDKAYFFLSVCFLLVSPIFFFIQLVKSIISSIISKSEPTINKKVFLVNANKIHLSKKANVNNIQCLIIKPSDKQHHNITSTLKVRHFLLAYLYSVVGTIYLFIKIKDKRNIIQAYIALDFFLVLLALKDIKHNMEAIYFCNHFDRWAVLIDNIFFDKELILIQHGVLPEAISLPYKLKNINKVLTLNKNSKERFIKYLLANTSEITFKAMDISLDLQTVKHDKKSILVIGQPHTIERELEIISRINKHYIVYIKPHPSFSFAPYSNIKNTILIKERHFYPKVDLVLNYESTLGIEYEASNIDVIWWKDKKIKELAIIIEQTLKNN